MTIPQGDTRQDPNQLAHQLTQLSTQLSHSRGSTFGCTPTLYYSPSKRDGARWSARVQVKEPRRRNRDAWAYGNTVEAALTALLVAVTDMASGTVTPNGGEVTR